MDRLASSTLTYFAFAYSSWKAYHLSSAVFVDGRYSALGILIYYVIVSAMFLSRNKSKAESEDPLDWLSAVVATWLPVHFTVGEPVTDGIAPLAATMQTLGTIGMLLAISKLSTSFGIIPANRGIKVHGVYQYVRHPLYSAELLNVFGFVLLNGSGRNVVLFVGLVALQVHRILNEERLLTQDPEYRAYCDRVRHRLIPQLF